MGKRGRKTEPTPLKILKGNPGKRSLSTNEPRFAAGEIECPEWLGEAGRAKWDERMAVVSKVKGLMTEADIDAFGLYCEAYEEMLAAKAEIERCGLIAISLKGGQYQHPAVGVKNKAIQRMKQLGALFGFSPSDRVGLNMAPREEEKDPLVAMLKARRERA